MEHVMVTPGYPPVRIGDGPTIETHGVDRCDWLIRENGTAVVLVGGAKVVEITIPWPDPVQIPGTPYEAYVCAGWSLNVFAIRLRPDEASAWASTTPDISPMYEPDSCPDGNGCDFHKMRHVHPVPELPPLRVETLNIRRGGIRFPVDPATEAAFNEAKGQQP